MNLTDLLLHNTLVGLVFNLSLSLPLFSKPDFLLYQFGMGAGVNLTLLTPAPIEIVKVWPLWFHINKLIVWQPFREEIRHSKEQSITASNPLKC